MAVCAGKPSCLPPDKYFIMLMEEVPGGQLQPWSPHYTPSCPSRPEVMREAGARTCSWTAPFIPDPR